MKVIGIIAEYNPFHKGHAYQIAEARKGQPEGTVVVAVMSGSFTERGEVALLPKYDRAEMAVRGGVDVVFELPYPFSAAGAEFFASAGVRLLTGLGADELVFGSESGDAGFLRHAAEVALSDEFRAAFQRENGGGKGSAEAYFGSLCDFLGVSSFGSNDVLGVEYMKAILAEKSPMVPRVIRRVGSGYLDATLPKEGYPSATAIRSAVLSAGRDTGRETGRDAERGAEGGAEGGEACERALSLLPEYSEEVLRRAIAERRAPVSFGNQPFLCPSFFRLRPKEEIGRYAECRGGLANRLCAVAGQTVTGEAFFEAAATKKYTDSRIRRAVLYALTGVTEADLRAEPVYLNLLGASEQGRKFLSQYRKRGGRALEIVTRPAAVLRLPRDLEEKGENRSRVALCQRQLELQQKSEALYTLLMPDPRPAGEFFLSRPFLL